MSYDFAGKKIAVVGIARSGMAAAEVLSRRGALVTLYDGKDAALLAPQLDWARENGIQAVSLANTIAPSDIAVVSPGIRADAPIIRSIRDQKIELWGEIEAAYRVSEAPILAATGTNGKTTTVLLLAEMIRAAGRVAYPAGNIAAGDLALPLIAAADRAERTEAIVAEISSFQLETIQSFRPAVAAILNITPDHEDRQTWREYVASKWRIFENQSDGDTAVLSTYVPVPFPAPHLPPNVIYFDKAMEPTWLNDLKLPGKHNRLNALAASAMAASFGIPKSAIQAAATSFKGVVHRLEYISEVDGVTYINNSMCTNNAAFSSSLESLVGPKIVIAGGVYKGSNMLPIAQAVARNSVKRVVAFGRSGKDIADTIAGNTDVEIIAVDDLSAAFERAVIGAISGDTIILNPGCASFDQFRDFEHRGDEFKALVNSLRKEPGE
jgi:UDP-N-acetylmuramoylalanine--D-glutamate ligase